MRGRERGSLLTQRRSTHTVPSFFIPFTCSRQRERGEREGMTFSHAMSAVFCIGCDLYLFMAAVLLSAVLFRLIYSVARRLLTRGKCGEGREGGCCAPFTCARQMRGRERGSLLTQRRIKEKHPAIVLLSSLVKKIRGSYRWVLFCVNE